MLYISTFRSLQLFFGVNLVNLHGEIHDFSLLEPIFATGHASDERAFVCEQDQANEHEGWGTVQFLMMVFKPGVFHGVELHIGISSESRGFHGIGV